MLVWSALKKTRNEVAGHASVTPNRRAVLKAGVGMVAASFFAPAGDAMAENAAGAGPYIARAYGVSSATGPFKEIQVERREMGPKDVLLDILYCSVFHTTST